MREGDQQNITYHRHRYRSRETELETTPDMKDRHKEVVEEEEMIDPKSREEMNFDSF